MRRPAAVHGPACPTMVPTNPGESNGEPTAGSASSHGSSVSPYFGNDFEPSSTSRGMGSGEMVECAKPRVPRQRPSKDQYKFLETLRDLGPQDNAQTATVRKATKRACQVRGWIEWRSLDQIAGVKAWHLTIIGGRVLNSLARRVDSRSSAQLPNARTPVPVK